MDAESRAISGDEGIPHLEMYGVSARVELDSVEVQPFCRLAGYKSGDTKTRVRLFGGYIWVLSSPDYLYSHSECTTGFKLQNKWFNGFYLKCHGSMINTGSYICYIVQCFHLEIFHSIIIEISIVMYIILHDIVRDTIR